ncbi:MAG: helix-turn-helix domain-containing protein [Actinomycetota bacterium]|nr:helix-turn-helix domain-containing protein [Actinomycetota bacterium]
MTALAEFLVPGLPASDWNSYQSATVVHRRLHAAANSRPAATIDVLYLRMLYHRLNLLYESATTTQQRRHQWLAHQRLTAVLIAQGWRPAEVADALGVSKASVQDWQERGQRLEGRGVALPLPAAAAAPGAGSPRLTLLEVADRLRVDRATIRRWIRSGALPASQAGGAANSHWLIDASVLKSIGADQPLMTVDEVAAQYGVTAGTVRIWIRRGQLSAIRLPGKGAIRIPAGAKRTQPTAADSSSRF